MTEPNPTRAHHAKCPNCPPGYCWTGNYLTVPAPPGPCAPRTWGCGYPDCECDRNHPCGDTTRLAAETETP